jgi:hypothetical protein
VVNFVAEGVDTKEDKQQKKKRINGVVCCSHWQLSKLW